MPAKKSAKKSAKRLVLEEVMRCVQLIFDYDQSMGASSCEDGRVWSDGCLELLYVLRDRVKRADDSDPLVQESADAIRKARDDARDDDEDEDDDARDDDEDEDDDARDDDEDEYGFSDPDFSNIDRLSAESKSELLGESE